MIQKDPLPLGKGQRLFADSEEEDDVPDGNMSDVRSSMPGANQIKLAKAQIVEVKYEGGPAKRGPPNVLAPDLGSSMGSG